MGVLFVEAIAKDMNILWLLTRRLTDCIGWKFWCRARVIHLTAVGGNKKVSKMCRGQMYQERSCEPLIYYNKINQGQL